MEDRIECSVIRERIGVDSIGNGVRSDRLECFESK